MMTFATFILAALTSASLQRSPVQILVQEEHMRNQLMQSELANLPAPEREKALQEHVRIGSDLEKLFGFAMGKAFSNYVFQVAVTNENEVEQSIFLLPKPTLGFTEFRPLVTEATLCGICLRRDLEEEPSEKDFKDAETETRMYFCAQIGLQQENFLRSTNGVRHAWRFSFEHWNKALVFRISDEELVAALLRAADERRRGAKDSKKGVVPTNEPAKEPQKELKK